MPHGGLNLQVLMHSAVRHFTMYLLVYATLLLLDLYLLLCDLPKLFIYYRYENFADYLIDSSLSHVWFAISSFSCFTFASPFQF
jgi:hypothetical protein